MGKQLYRFYLFRLKEKEIFSMGTLLKKKSVYLVELGEEDDYLDILPKFVKWENYKASSGHKVNHDKVGKLLHLRFWK